MRQVLIASAKQENQDNYASSEKENNKNSVLFRMKKEKRWNPTMDYAVISTTMSRNFISLLFGISFLSVLVRHALLESMQVKATPRARAIAKNIGKKRRKGWTRVGKKKRNRNKNVRVAEP